MTEGWVAPGRGRERILVYGAMGSRKTSGALEIARKCAGDLYVVDTDDAYETIIERAYPDVEGKVHVKVVEDWEQFTAAVEWAFGKAGRDDWVVIDSASDAWDFAMDAFSEFIRGEDVSDYVAGWAKRNDKADVKKTGFQGSLIEEGLYDFVNPAWRKKVVRPVKVPKCHVYITAQAQVAGTNPREDQQTKSLYGGIGWKPRTQKELGFATATVMYLEKDKMGKGSYSVAKNWGREEAGALMGEKYTNFASDFLFRKCGWRPAKKEAE